MRQNIILDTGPLVAYLDRMDTFHVWSRDLWKDLAAPLFTSESVISETCFLLSGIKGGTGAVFELLNRNVIAIQFQLADETSAIAAPLTKYSDTPMSVADASLVRMAERIPQTSVFTLDSDFKHYRKHGRHVIPLIIPD